MGGIRDISHQINSENNTLLIEDLNIKQIFKDETKKEEASVTDLVLLVLRLLKEDIQKVIDFIEPVELQDKK